MKKYFVLILFCFLPVFSCAEAFPAWKPGTDLKANQKFLDKFSSDLGFWYGAIEKVADGDTFYIDFYSHKHLGVRIKGIDTPETVDERKDVQFGGIEASDYSKTVLVPGTLVCLRFYDDMIDSFGRLLADVWIWDGNSWINWAEHLLKQGLAVVYYKYPVRGLEQLLAAQEHAVKNMTGVWAQEDLIEQDIAHDLKTIFANASWYRKELKAENFALYREFSELTGKK